MERKQTRRAGLGLTLGLGAVAVLAAGARPPALEATQCGGFRGPECVKESLCVGWWIFKKCREKTNYWPEDAVDDSPTEIGPIGF